LFWYVFMLNSDDIQDNWENCVLMWRAMQGEMCTANNHSL